MGRTMRATLSGFILGGLLAPHLSHAAPCEQWKGREFISRIVPDAPGCIGGCAVQLVEESGHTARWKITGGRCSSQRPRPVPQGQPAAENAPQASQEDEGYVVKRVPRVIKKGEAKNADEKPIEGVPPGVIGRVKPAR
jgi:hypothetical protein